MKITKKSKMIPFNCDSISLTCYPEDFEINNLKVALHSMFLLVIATLFINYKMFQHKIHIKHFFNTK